MTSVDQLVPIVAQRDLGEILDDVGAASELSPFAEEAIAFCDALSRRLFRDPAGRAYPELVVLGYWLRRASVLRLRDAFVREAIPGTTRVPRGLVFHVPPTNVDTMAVYSLALSVLVGNHNLMRISPRQSPQMVSLLSALIDTFADDRFKALRSGTALISYGHEDEVTVEASAVSDVRILWGGDETVSRLRRFPLRADARDVTFPDRFSFASIGARAWLDAPEAQRDELAKALYDDAYWFDQMGCASPRLVVWCGDRQLAEAGAEDLYPRLAHVIETSGYSLETGAVIGKLTYAFGAAFDRPVVSARREGNALTVLRLETLEGFDRTHPGAGLLFEALVPTLGHLRTFISRKDQTMTAFGFSANELEEFVRSANGRGIDRIVPFGQALAFDRLWDGMDLLAELTRRVVVAVSERGSVPNAA